MSDGEVYLTQLMRDFFDQNEKWPKFSYGEVTEAGVVYVYHTGHILALVGPTNVVIRRPGSYFNYCGTLVVPLFERFIPEDPDFFAQVSDAIDTAIRLIENGETT